MTDTDQRKLELKRAKAEALKAKMDLHDLSEELPCGWESIEEVARRAKLAYAALARLESSGP